MRIVYIDVDSLRPDHLGCYGYHRNTSPEIDAIAEEGVRYDNYYVTDAPCLPSRTAITTGTFGIKNGAVGHGGAAADLRVQGATRRFQSDNEKAALATIARRAGCHTALFSPFAERHSAFQFYAGFNEIHNTGKGGMESAEDVTPGVLKFLDERGTEENWYMHVNYWDPHTFFRAPEEFGNPFEDDPIPEWLTPETFEKHRMMPGPHTAQEITMYNSDEFDDYPRHLGALKDMADLKRHIDGYDCGVAYADQHIGMVVAKLKELGVYEDTVIVVSADHGENQGELGLYSEHATADQATCRVPMIVKWPGGRQGASDKDLHYHIDWLPTLADLLGQSHHPQWDGSSYAGTVTEDVSQGQEFLVMGQFAHVCQRSVRFDDYLYMRTWHDGYHLFPEEMLFNIVEDPHEQVDLAKTMPDVCATAAGMLESWTREQLASVPDGIDPMVSVMAEGGPYHARLEHLPPYVERLRVTGRGDSADLLVEKYPEAFA